MTQILDENIKTMSAKVKSGSVKTTTAKTSTFYCDWKITNQSIENNYSDIYWKIYLKITGGDQWYSNAVQIKSLKINDSTIVSSKKYSNIQGKGDHQLIDGTVRVYHDTTGNKELPIELTGYLYSYGNQTGSGSFELETIPRYASITNFSVDKRDETSVLFKYSIDSVCDMCWYSTDDGANWNELSENNIVSGLSPNTSYNFKLRVRRKDSQLTTDSNRYIQSTYDYPRCTEAPNFTIGENVTLKFYNPLNRTIQIQMWSHIGSQFVSDLITISGTSYTGFADVADRLYSSIPNNKESKYNIDVHYSENKAVSMGGNYSIKGNEVPVFNDFTYKDINTLITDVTGNDQVLIKGLSNLKVEISTLEKMVPQKSASAKSYTASVDILSKTVEYSENDISINIGAITNAGTKRLNVTAFDSRNLSKVVYKDVQVLDYSKPVINHSVKRLNDFENQTTLSINGTFTKIPVNNVNKNTIKTIQYRYRETEGNWGNWINVEFSIDDNKYVCNDVIMSLDNTKSFEFEIKVTDNFDSNLATDDVEIGQAIFFISTNKKACYINGDEIIMYDILEEW